MDETDLIYNEGYAAYRNGTEEHHNPYRGLNAEYWSDGWEDSKEDEEQEELKNARLDC